MNPEVETIRENLRLGKLAEIISKSKYNSFPVVDQADHLTGILSFFETLCANGSLPFSDRPNAQKDKYSDKSFVSQCYIMSMEK